MSNRVQDQSMKPIQLHRGVRQGDVISPKLFTAALEDVFKLLNWNRKGIAKTSQMSPNTVWKKSNRYLDFVLSPTNIEKFLKEAADSQYGATKLEKPDAMVCIDCHNILKKFENFKNLVAKNLTLLNKQASVQRTNKKFYNLQISETRVDSMSDFMKPIDETTSRVFDNTHVKTEENIEMADIILNELQDEAAYDQEKRCCDPNSDSIPPLLVYNHSSLHPIVLDIIDSNNKISPIIQNKQIPINNQTTAMKNDIIKQKPFFKSMPVIKLRKSLISTMKNLIKLNPKITNQTTPIGSEQSSPFNDKAVHQTSTLNGVICKQPPKISNQIVPTMISEEQTLLNNKANDELFTIDNIMTCETLSFNYKAVDQTSNIHTQPTPMIGQDQSSSFNNKAIDQSLSIKDRIISAMASLEQSSSNNEAVNQSSKISKQTPNTHTQATSMMMSREQSSSFNNKAVVLTADDDVIIIEQKSQIGNQIMPSFVTPKPNSQEESSSIINAGVDQSKRIIIKETSKRKKTENTLATSGFQTQMQKKLCLSPSASIDSKAVDTPTTNKVKRSHNDMPILQEQCLLPSLFENKMLQSAKNKKQVVKQTFINGKGERSIKYPAIDYCFLPDDINNLIESSSEIESSGKQENDDCSSELQSSSQKQENDDSSSELQPSTQKQENECGSDALGTEKIKRVIITGKELTEERNREKSKVHFQSKPFKCMGCIEGFDDRQSYLEHRAIKHKKAGSELCEICKKRFITKTALFMHRKQHFVRYECVTCGKRHPDLCSISRHYKRKHEIELEFKCDHCDYTTEYECVTCGKRHPDLCSISRHYKRKHEIGLEFKHFGPTVPLAIPLVVPSERAMRGHAKSHKDWFMCYYCPMPKPFTREGHLKLHHLKKHTFPCMICEKKFGYRRYLKQHTASKHPGFDAALYCECDCKTCGERFRSFISLSQHLRQYSTHDPLLKFECDECAELFVSKHSIQNHITMRHLKPFKVFQAEMAQAVLSAGAEHKRLKRQLIRERRLLRAASRPLDLSESDFVKHFCLRKSQFLALCNDICPLLPDPQRTTAVRPDIKVCDADLRILHVDASFGGAASDSHVWGSSPVSALMERLHDSGEESRLLGDSGYAQRPWLMTPILNAEPNTPEEHYNYQHDRTRNVVGRCIGVLKTRWRCLLAHRTMYYHPVKAGKVVNACVVLHNLINDPHIDIDEEEMARDRARQPSQVRTDDYEDVKNAARFSRTREAVVDRLWSTR